MAFSNNNMQKPLLRLNIIIHQDDNEWVAHCLEMDIVATNTTAKKAEDDIIDLIKTQVIYAVENNNFDNLFKSAPPEAWSQLRDAHRCESKIIKISPPKAKTTHRKPPFKEVELCFA